MQWWILDERSMVRLVDLGADSEEAARVEAAHRGLSLLGPKNWRPIARSARPGTNIDFDTFCVELIALLRAGLTIVEAVQTLTGSANPVQAKYCERLVSSLSRGERLSSAMRADSSSPVLLTALIEGAEHTSNLANTLELYLNHSRKLGEIRRRISASVAYPFAVSLVGAAVASFLLLFVVPRFASLYESIGRELPSAAQLMVSWSTFLSRYGAWLGVAVALMTAFVIIEIRLSRLQHRVFKAAGRFPRIGAVLHSFALARYFRTIGMLLVGGIPLSPATSLAQSMLPLPLHGAGDSAQRRIKEGVRPSVAFRESGLTTPVLERLLAAGERSAQLGQLMIEAADFHETQVLRVIERSMRVLEPALTVFIGLAVGALVVLMYMPIFELASALD